MARLGFVQSHPEFGQPERNREVLVEQIRQVECDLLVLPELCHSGYVFCAAAVVAYLISPVDLLPEALLGPLGLADDVALAFMALDLMLNRVDQEIVRQLWRGEADLLAVSQAGLKLARRVIPAPLYNRLLRWIEARP